MGAHLFDGRSNRTMLTQLSAASAPCHRVSYIVYSPCQPDHGEEKVLHILLREEVGGDILRPIDTGFSGNGRALSFEEKPAPSGLWPF